jgi:predicted dehydrogenase
VPGWLRSLGDGLQSHLRRFKSGLWLHTCLVLACRETFFGEDNLKVAVIGMGKMGIVHSCVLSVVPSVEVVALCEKSLMIRRFLKKLFAGAKIVDDAWKLADLDLDAVYVTTPIPSHYSIAKTVYLKKVARNLFVEKTLTENFKESKELCGLADCHGGVNMVGYLRRFYVTFGKAKDLLSRGAIGELHSFSIHAFSSDFLGSSQGSAASLARGGVLRDLGCHALDLALWYFGDLRIRPNSASSPNTDHGEDVLSFGASNSHGLEGKFDISWCIAGYRMPEVGISVKGSNGTIDVSDDLIHLREYNGRESTWYRHDLNDNVPFWLGLPEYYREDLHFVESVKAGSNGSPDFFAAAKVDELIAEVEKLWE